VTLAVLGSQVFGSRGLLVVVLALYLFMRLVDWRLGVRDGARPLPLVSPVWSVVLLGFAAWSLYDGARSGSATEITLGVLLSVACVDSLLRWRRERPA
jgi:hypothetical protein